LPDSLIGQLKYMTLKGCFQVFTGIARVEFRRRWW
jgi:hypothetical protein